MNVNPIKWTRNVKIGQSGLASADGRFQIVRFEEYILGTRCVSFRLYVDGIKVATGKQGEMKAKVAEIVAAESETIDAPAEAEVTTRKIEALPMQHAPGDERPATRIEVLVDGDVIGYITSDSVASYAEIKNSRIRGRFLGYRRSYLGHLTTNRFKSMPTNRNADTWNSSRKRAIEELVEAWKRATAN